MTEEPLAFVTSLEDASSDEIVREQFERAPDTAIFGALDHGLVGMLWFARESRTKLAHKALIWHVFVRKEFRGRGIAGDLLRAAIAHARSLSGLTALWLGVSETAPDARKLYERHGFQVWGIEPDCICADGQSARLYYMELRLE